MPEILHNTLKTIFIFCLTAGAVWAGYKFLAIKADFLFAEKPDPQPVLTVSTLDANGHTVEDVPTDSSAANTGEPAYQSTGPSKAPPTSAQLQEQSRLHIVGQLQKSGADVKDSKIFTDKAACDAAVRKVVGEYRRRGVPEPDTAETAQFPDSTGLVWMVQFGGQLYYIGCYASAHVPWAVYIHFIPNANGAPVEEGS